MSIDSVRISCHFDFIYIYLILIIIEYDKISLHNGVAKYGCERVRNG